MSKLLCESIDLKIDNVVVKSHPHHESLRTSLISALSETLNLLLNKIKQTSDDEMSRSYKQRLQQKVINAAHLFLAKNALLEDRNRFLTAVNDEGKVRRSIRSEILRKTRMISYEDLKKARADRVTKETAKEIKRADTVSKREHNRKYKDLEPADISETQIEVGEIDETQIEENAISSKP